MIHASVLPTHTHTHRRADPTVHLTDDAPVDEIVAWLEALLDDDVIQWTRDGSSLMFDLPYYAALTYVHWHPFITSVE